MPTVPLGVLDMGSNLTRQIAVIWSVLCFAVDLCRFCPLLFLVFDLDLVFDLLSFDEVSSAESVNADDLAFVFAFGRL